MPLLKGGTVVADPYVRILDDSPIPEEGAVLIPAARFLADAGDIARRPGRTGVLWPNDRAVAELAPHLERLAMVALNFPVFKDGRAYSQARVLRENYGFRSELRATGNVLRDQFLFLYRAGFDAFEVSKPCDAQAFAEVLSRYSGFYQPGPDGRPVRLRQRALSPAE